MIIWHVAGALVLLGATVGAVWAVMGPEQIWRAMFGSPDLGGIRFETVERRTSPNDALACPPNLCNARADVVPPVFGVPARELRLTFGRIIQREPLITFADADDLVPSERYVQRTATMRFPDTIDVRFIDLPEGRSTIAIYSRSQIGWSDRGVNRQRIDRLLEALTRLIPPVT